VSELVQTASGGLNGRAGLDGVDPESRSGLSATARQRPGLNCAADRARRAEHAGPRPRQFEPIVVGRGPSSGARWLGVARSAAASPLTCRGSTMAGSGAKRRCRPLVRDAATSGDAHLLDRGLLRAENVERGVGWLSDR